MSRRISPLAPVEQRACLLCARPFAPGEHHMSRAGYCDPCSDRNADEMEYGARAIRHTIAVALGIAQCAREIDGARS